MSTFEGATGGQLFLDIGGFTKFDDACTRPSGSSSRTAVRIVKPMVLRMRQRDVGLDARLPTNEARSSNRGSVRAIKAPEETLRRTASRHLLGGSPRPFWPEHRKLLASVHRSEAYPCVIQNASHR